MADKNLPAGNEPLHVGGLDAVGVEQVTARPDHGGGAVTEAAELFALEFRRMLQMFVAMVNVALARTALEENRDGEQRLPILDGAHQTRLRDLADIPLAM